MKKLLLTILFGAFGLMSEAQQRYVGGDISLLPTYEANGAWWNDENNQHITDMLQYLKAQGLNSLRAGFITQDGFCYKAEVPCRNGVVEIPLASLRLSDTAIRPETYPGFLPDYFVPDPALATPFRAQDIEFFEIGTPTLSSAAAWSLNVTSCWLK